ncbi:ATP-binding cassette domain-containing protein [bacterium]|nr:ATP-binding cassette domain-containing protein [bacterium]
MPSLLDIRSLTKRFPGVLALDGVNLAFEPGRIHALVGENGAGKSTLIKIIAGILRAEKGELRFDGQSVAIRSPHHARRLGISVVHQHTHLIPDLSVAENYALRGAYPRHRLGPIAWRRLASLAHDATASLIPSMDVRRRARSLTGVEKQLVELSFALAAAPRLLILDEPTAVLPRRETEQLFAHLRRFVAAGGSVLFISHRLDEVFGLADDVTVLRDGRVVWCKDIAATNHDDLIRDMVGREASFERVERMQPSEDAHVRIAGLTDAAGAFRGVDLTLRRGEIVGIYGLVGAGQSELCQALFGLRATAAGSVRVGDRLLEPGEPRARVRAGVGYVPADRLVQGMFARMSVGENLSIAVLDRLAPHGWLHVGQEAARNRESIERLQVRTLGPDQGVAKLSGGNQQKVLLGRWLQTDPSALILEEPTQGVDVGAKSEIHRIITRLAAGGACVLLVSSELPELMTLAHRIAVFREGLVVGDVDPAAAGEEAILRLALPEAESKEQAAAASARPAHGRARAAAHWLLAQREASIALFVGLLVVVLAATTPRFATLQNLEDILVNTSLLIIGALGISAVIIAGSIDISIGAILGAAAVAAGLADQYGVPAPLLPLIPLAVGVALAVANGALSVFGRVHAIVITLGTLSIYRALIIQVTGGRWLMGLSERVTVYGQSKPCGVPILLVASLATAGAAHVFLRYTVAGRRLYALGGDRASAEALGITPRRVAPQAFGLCGLSMGLAGLLHAGHYGQVQTNAGSGFELQAIAAAVIGGAHIMGGRGSALGAFLGALLIGILANAVVLANLSEYWIRAVVGAMILLAIGTDALVRRRPGGSG